MPQMLQVLRERAIGKLTAGTSTRAFACEVNVHFSTISRLQMRFREFGSTKSVAFIILFSVCPHMQQQRPGFIMNI